MRRTRGRGSGGCGTRGEVDPGWRQVLVDQDALAGGELLEGVERGEVVDVFVAGLAPVAVGVCLAPGLGAGAAEQFGPVAQRLEVADAGQEQAQLGVGDGGAGDLAAAVEVLDLGEVVVDEQQLDAVAA